MQLFASWYSTRSVGLAYEKLSMAVLKLYSFDLNHTGGSHDGGQDFIGRWILPDRIIPIVGQCKCHSRAIGPKDVREFEDVLYRKFLSLSHPFPKVPAVTGHIGVIVSRSWLTSSALKTLYSSKMPMLAFQIIESTPKDETLQVLEPPDPEPASNSFSKDGPNKQGKETRGYINEVALNGVARKQTGRLQVTWQYSTKGKSYSQRKLVFVYD